MRTTALSLWTRLGPLAIVPGLFAPPALAGGGTPRFLVSTTSDVAASGSIPAVGDGDVVLVEAGATPRPMLQAGHWLATTGLDLGDIDALARRFGEPPGTYRSLAFSTLSNVGAFLDGDILGLAAGGGAEIVVSEEKIALSVGLPGAPIDVDAAAWDSLGNLLFSFQNDLDGTALGMVQDGDVLALLPDGTAARILSEADVDAKMLQASGSSAAVGDVQGIEVVSGEIWVVVQSPSDADGGVLSCGSTPALVLTEAGAGLGGAELDALLLADDADVLPTVALDPQASPVGGAVHVAFHGDPGGALLVLYAGNAGFHPFGAAPGFGAWYMDPADPWLNSILLLPTLPLVPLDGSGRYEVDYVIPPGTEGIGLAGDQGWSFQVIDLGSLVVSAPFRVRV